MALNWDTIKKDLSKAGSTFGKGIDLVNYANPMTALPYLASKGIKNYVSNRYTTPASIPSSSTSGAKATVDTPITNQDSYLNYALSDIGEYTPSKYTGGSGGLDLNSLYGAYENQANAQKATVKTSIAQQRQDLLDSIARVREDIATSKKQKQQNFQSTRADLEERAMMADRSNRISAAGRGLSGSGLQQLAQLQNMIASGKEISGVANEVRDEQDTLAQTLKRSEEDTTKNVNNLSISEQNQLNQIIANLTSNKTSAAEQDRASRASASSAAAAYAAADKAAYEASKSTAIENAKDRYSAATALSTSILGELKEKVTSKTKASARANAREALESGMLGSGDVGLKTYNNLISRINAQD